LDEKQRARITDFSGKLRNEACRSKCHVLNGSAGPKQVLLIYVPYSRHTICETANNDRRAWARSDQQNLLLTPERRQAIERDKRIVEFQNIHSQPFHEEDIDLDLLKQFRESYPHDSVIYQYSTEEFLRKVGAVERDKQKDLHLTNAGLLFFGKNPQAPFAQAYIRLMKFDGRHDEATSLPTLDQKYDGPLTVQLREIRAFLQKSGFFKTYQRRSETGGFKEEPELPYIAVDEAIVNAVGHRDYAVGEAIQVRLYRDALTVQNPGRVTQIGHDVPHTFTLDQTELDSSARNAKIMEWMRTMRDADGKAFVQLLSEGTSRMNSEMVSLGLPPPEFRLTPFRSRLILFSRAEEREAKYRQEAIATTEFANLYPLHLDVKGLGEIERRELLKTINLALINRLKSLDWFVNSFRFGRITIHQSILPMFCR
jgi:predicted HTH transcriptional regulator